MTLSPNTWAAHLAAPGSWGSTFSLQNEGTEPTPKSSSTSLAP